MGAKRPLRLIYIMYNIYNIVQYLGEDPGTEWGDAPGSLWTVSWQDRGWNTTGEYNLVFIH